jgi:hypothetical protein
LKGDKELAATHAGDAKHVLAQLGNIQQTGPGGKAIQTITKQFLDGTIIKARTDVKGLNIVEITSGFKQYGESKKEEKYIEYTVKYIAPVLLCYSWIEESPNYYYKSTAELMAVVRDLETIAYVYEPTKKDKISEKSTATYVDEDPEYEYTGIDYGSADNEFSVVTENYEKRVKIRELWDITRSARDEVYTNTSSSFQTIGDYTEASGIYQEITTQPSSLTIFGNSDSATLIGHYYQEWHKDDPNVNYITIDYDYSEKIGKFFSGATAISVNPSIPGKGTKNYSDPSDAYMYVYQVEDRDDKIEGPLEIGHSVYEEIMVRKSTVYLGLKDTDLNYLKPVISTNVYETFNNLLDSFGVDWRKFIFNNNGNPVFLTMYSPQYRYLQYGDRQESGIRTDGMFNKVFYTLSYGGKVFETSADSGFEKLGDVNCTHIFKSSKGNTIKDKDGKTYYTASTFRMVEVEETIREKVL